MNPKQSKQSKQAKPQAGEKAKADPLADTKPEAGGTTVSEAERLKKERAAVDESGARIEGEIDSKRPAKPQG